MSLHDFCASLRARGQRALVPFFTAGYPDEETFLRLLDAASRTGCQAIEIGIPFSDPIADGPTIQRASERALAQGMDLQKALQLARRAAPEMAAKLIVMSYLNPILAMGIERFARTAREAGVAGLIVPDAPVEEAAELRAALRGEGVVLIDLVAPTSSPARIERIAAGAQGFLYLVALCGVSGSRGAQQVELQRFIERVRARAELPLYVGFGIATPEQAGDIARRADGIIVGSALIRAIQAAPSAGAAVEAVRELLLHLRRALAIESGSQVS